MIDAGDRALSASAPLVLDASGSYDPDGSPEPLTFTWSCAPAPCFDHTVSYYPDKMVIFGGRDNSRIFKAMHLFDLETLTWENDVIMPDFSSDVSPSRQVGS